MNIVDILKTLKNQYQNQCKLQEFNKDYETMLRTFTLISKQLEILRIWTNLKFLQLTVALLVMSLLTVTHYKIVSVILTLISIGLVGYIIIDNFITLKHSYEELKLSCTLKPENPVTIPSSD